MKEKISACEGKCLGIFINCLLYTSDAADE